MEHEVIAVRHHAPGIVELVLERGDYAFVAGESAVLFGPDSISRPYSIASGPSERELRFLIRVMRGGVLSPWLAERQPGERLQLSPPFGHFRPDLADEEGCGAVFVATGVGIAPFLSYVQCDGGKHRHRCLYGVRTFDDAVHLALLRRTTQLTLAVSREVVDGCAHGRVTDLLASLALVEGQHYFLCGYDGMVDAVMYWLTDRGVPLDHIHGEVFFAQ